MNEQTPLPYRVAARAEVRCIAATIRLLAHRRMHLPATHVGMVLRFADGTPMAVERLWLPDHVVPGLADGPADRPTDLLDDAMSHRQPPGWGEFPLVACLKVLADIGVRAPTGPEVYRPECADRPAGDVAAELYRATVDVLQRI